MIEQERIDAVKRGVDLVGLIRSRGVALKKNGQGYRGLCPFHEDDNPSLSVTPAKNLWQCFGCQAGGDAIRFVELHDRVPFHVAVERLAAMLPGEGAKADVKQSLPPKEPHPEPVPKPATAQKLLARVAAFYQHTFTTDTRGLEYLKSRGITGKESFQAFGCGFANGTLKDALTEDEELRSTLKQLGVINAKGNEPFFNAVTFPLHDESGAVVGLYGRSLFADGAVVPHRYTPGPRRGLVNRQAVKRSSTILLTESIIDALTLHDQGFTNVIPCYGVNGFTSDHLALFEGKVREVYVVFDNDEAGRLGAHAVIEQLKKKEINCHCVELPEKDVNLYFQRHTAEEFEQLLASANPASRERSGKVADREQTLFRDDAHGFVVAYGGREYQVKGIQKSETQLKATVKVAADLADPRQPFELTTIDLYSSRSRMGFARLAAGLFGCAEELVKEDLGRILGAAEDWRPKAEEKPGPPEASEADKRRAMALLASPAMFAEVLADFETMGVTGEETNKLVGYLAATSRKLADPLSVLIQSRSAAGKSTLQDAILSFIPPEDFIKYTRVTDQALFYKDEDSLVNKILAIEEAEGMGGAAYSIRNIQSAKRITVAATGKDAATGRMRTEEYTVNGPVSVMITTTQTDVDQETASRFIFLTIDESRAMTEAIHRMQREAETLEGLIKSRKQEGIIAKHHTAQRMLKNLSVVNPYSQYLTFPGNSLRSRRDHKKYLGLIRAVAFLHQHQREVKTVEVEGSRVEYIEVTLADIEVANQLANDVLGQSMDELAKPSRTLLSLIHAMVSALAAERKMPVDEVHFTRRMVREYTGWTDWQVKTHIRQLEDLEYLAAHMGSKGKEYSYILNYHGQGEDSGRCYLSLTTVEEIQIRMRQGIAANLEGESGHLEGKNPGLEG